MVLAVEKNLGSQHLARLREFGERMTGLGANFAFCSRSGEVVFLSDGGGFKSRKKELTRLSEQVLSGDRADGEIYLFSETHLVLGCILKAGGKNGAILLAAGRSCLPAPETSILIRTTN